MSIRNLDGIFAPRSVALIGASTRERSVGDVLARNLFGAGFAGPVMAVNPHAATIRSTVSYASIAALPVAPDLGVVCTPPDTVPQVIDELGRAGARAAVVITAGFGELGAEGRALQQKMLDAAKPHLLRIVGPNCVGVLSPHARLNASFAHVDAPAGRLAFVAQSGAVITSVLDWAAARGIGFSHLVSVGAMADVDFGDLLDHFAGDPNVDGVLLYVEAITEARKFMSAARRCARVKPVIAVKAGRFEEGAKAAASHTGALAGADSVYDAAFRRAGMLRVLSLPDLFDAVETLARGLKADGDRLAIITNGGGMGVLAADSLIEGGCRLAELTPQTIAALDEKLPRTWSRGNPVDIIGDAPGARYAAAMDAVLRDPAADGILVLNCPVAIADSREAAEAVIASWRARPEPQRRRALLTAWLGETSAEPARARFDAEGIATFDTPDQAVRAFCRLVEYGRNQALLMETPDPAPGTDVDGGRAEARAIVEAALADGRSMLSEPEAKRVLAAYGVPVVPTEIARNPDEAAGRAAALGFPAAIKILSHDISHKSDVGGVALNLKDADAVRQAAEAMLKRVADAKPEAAIEGFAVQPMAARPRAHELIVGLTEDRVFGPVVLFGQGGTAVEVVRDKAVALLPLNMTLARELIARTRVSKLLAGYRDRPAADLDAVARVLIAIGELAADLPQVSELDINPLWADEHGVIALDARIKVAAGAKPGAGRFAIRPYPRDLERAIEDQKGKPYRLRPIRPEDAPRLQAMVEDCAPEDIRMRFFSALKRLPETLAKRLTQIDYDREMAFVAIDEPAGPDAPFAGVVRLSEDPDRERGEYAVIVRTGLKGTGLGYRLMQEIMDYGRARDLAEIFGEVLRENRPMLRLCDELGFARRRNADDPNVVEVVFPLK